MGVIRLASILAILTPSATTRAAEPGTALMPVEFTGEVTPLRRQRLQKAMEDGAERAHLAVAVVDKPPTCVGRACAPVLVRTERVRYVARTVVTIEHDDYRYELELLDAQGRVVATVTDSCPVCGLAEAQRTLEDQIVLLMAKVRALHTESPVLQIEVVPPATVYLDGVRRGPSPVRVETTPGPHLVRAQARGYQLTNQTVVAKAGVNEMIRLDLVRRPTSERLRPPGWALLAAGLSSLAAGGVLLGIDDRPQARSCTGRGRDANGHCLLLYDTLAPGATLTALGSAAVVAAVSMLLVSRRMRRMPH